MITYQGKKDCIRYKFNGCKVGDEAILDILYATSHFEKPSI